MFDGFERKIRGKLRFDKIRSILDAPQERQKGELMKSANHRLQRNRNEERSDEARRVIRVAKTRIINPSLYNRSD